MKTFLFNLFFSCLCIGVYSQEGLKIGISGGLPVGENAEPFTVHLQGNLDYLFHITREIHIGVTTGYSHYIGGELDGMDQDEFTYLPLGGTAQFHLSEKVKVGGDVGYAVVLKPENSDGGFFYVPKIQYSLSENTDFVLAYRGLSINSMSLSSISIGFEFGFF